MSFVNSNNLPVPRAVHGIGEVQKQCIMHFLQGSVYCWCNQTPLLVSLDPDIEKIQKIINVSFTPFDDVVQKIISTIQNE